MRCFFLPVRWVYTAKSRRNNFEIFQIFNYKFCVEQKYYETPVTRDRIILKHIIVASYISIISHREPRLWPRSLSTKSYANNKRTLVKFACACVLCSHDGRSLAIAAVLFLNQKRAPNMATSPLSGLCSHGARTCVYSIAKILFFFKTQITK